MQQFHRPKGTGLVEGDPRPIRRNDAASMSAPYMDKSLAGKSRADLKKGYCDEGTIRDATRSDPPDYA